MNKDENQLNESRKLMISELESLAEKIKKLKSKRKLRRPLVIEFCGTPKSGKSTTINSLNTFLKRNGFSTSVITEKAIICPVTNKTNPLFNIWTLINTLSELIRFIGDEEKKVKTDIILIDRGLFDALCWFEWLRNNGDCSFMDDEEFMILESFIMNKRILKNLDLIYIFKSNPSTSIVREYSNLLTDKRGSIMKENILTSFNNAIEIVHKKNDSLLKCITFETDEKEPNSVSYNVSKTILEALEQLLEESIGYFDSNNNISLRGIGNYSIIEKFKLQYDLRDKIEQIETYLQPIPIAVVTNKARNKVVCVKKNGIRTEHHSPEFNNLLLYVGGHVREEDKRFDKTSQSNIKIFQNTLQREIDEELGESVTINKQVPFLIYNPINDKSKKHIAVCFIIEMDLENKKFSPNSDEFLFDEELNKIGYVMDIEKLELDKHKYTFESWSVFILDKVFAKTNFVSKDLFT